MIIPNTKLDYPDDFILKTERLILRPPFPEDAQDLYMHTSDERITTYLAWEAHTNTEMTSDLINALQASQKDDRGYHWLICINGNIAGIISLIDVKRRHRSWIINKAELSYWLGISFQKNGYVTEAGKTVIQFAFEKLGLHKLVLGHTRENSTSEHVASRLGFEKYGTERDAFYKNNKWHSMVWNEILNPKGTS